ncbi:hypothetical protein, conserved [Leishmania lindenbergi]|uniref:Uncharacterized protein n=1 Tax=Leishmania lindenbergi TaxID=651832 RepID=A0AAW3AGW0_9TRYP
MAAACIHEIDVARATSHIPQHWSAASLDAAEAVVQRLQALCGGGDDRQVSGVSTRVLPLPIVEANTYLSTPTSVMPDYDAAGHRRRCSATVVGVSANEWY